MLPLLLTVNQAAKLLGVGRTTIYELMDSGELFSVHRGASRRIPLWAAYDYVDRLCGGSFRQIPVPAVVDYLARLAGNPTTVAWEQTTPTATHRSRTLCRQITDRGRPTGVAPSDEERDSRRHEFAGSVVDIAHLGSTLDRYRRKSRMSIHSKRLKNGRTSYEVKLRGPSGRQYSRSFRTRKEAEAFQVQERASQVQRYAGSTPAPGACRSRSMQASGLTSGLASVRGRRSSTTISCAIICFVGSAMWN